jgi:hypothetical protein
VTPADLPAAERCPTCDREGCRRAAAVAAYQDAPAGVDLLPLVIALIDTERECLDAEIDGKRARRARDVAERKRAFEELRTAAARWAKVAPLIEELRRVSINDGDDPQELEALRNELIAATEATP